MLFSLNITEENKNTQHEMYVKVTELRFNLLDQESKALQVKLSERSKTIKNKMYFNDRISVYGA